MILNNFGESPIDEFSIVAKPDDNFASLQSASPSVTVSNDTIRFNGTLEAGQTTNIDLNYSLNNCELRTITYSLIFGCPEASCTSEVNVIDDNEVFDFDIEIDQIDEFIYGFCEPKELSLIHI